jgi:hypothetical protein
MPQPVEGTDSELLHKLSQLWREPVIERRRSKGYSAAAGIGASQAREASLCTTIEAKDEGVNQRNDIDFALPFHHTQVACTTPNELGRNQTGQRIANVTYSGAGHLSSFGLEHPQEIREMARFQVVTY